MSGPFGSSQWMYASGGFYDFEISNSLKFDNASNQNLVFTPSSAGNLRAWTLSMWVKRSNISDQDHNIFSANAEDNFRFMADDTFNGSMYSAARSAEYANFDTSSVYRDGSAWYNIVYSWDSNNGTAANRLRVFVNGVNQTGLSGDNSYPSQNTDSSTNLAISHAIGKQANSTARNFDGYIAEVNFTDGTTNDASAFGEYKNDIWIPKDTSGLTFGTNGYRLQFKQTGTGQNALGVGADTSGNDNHFAASNITASDVVTDSPTNNFATINSLSNPSTVTSGNTFSEGNLKLAFSTAAGTFPSVLGTFPMVTGKWYWEFSYDYDSNINAGFGVYNQTTGLTTDYGGSQSGLDDAGFAIFRTSVIQKAYLNTLTTVHSSSFADPIIIGVMFDADNGKLYIKFANAELAGQTISNGTTIFDTFTTGKLYMPAIYHGDGGSGTKTGTIYANFGQDSSFSGSQTAQGNTDANGKGDFYYAPPSGYLALCTANLPDPVKTIDPAQGGSPQDYFNSTLYTGTGSLLAVTTGFQPDWTWIKSRNATDQHVVQDSVRGNFILYPDSTQTEGATGGGWVTETSTGFTADANGPINTSGDTYVAWNWKAGTAFSNDASATGVGSIDSSGSVNTDVGFSIISYTSTTGTVAHGLGVAPNVIIIKPRNNTDQWTVGHDSLATSDAWNYGIPLNTTAAKQTNSGFWNNTAPTSSVFSTGSWNNSYNIIAYCFASVDGYSKFGSYEGNSNADGPFVYTGFRVAWLLIKKINSTDDWAIHDSKRVDYGTNSNPIDDYLKPNSTAVEGDDGASVDFLSNGFKWRINSGMRNNSGDTYIYMAFAEQPFKYANAR